MNLWVLGFEFIILVQILIMKTIILFLTGLFFTVITCLGQVNPNHVYVKPYYNSSGTYVPGHYRTAPNNTNRDNFSTYPNTNPYTGKPGYIKPYNNSSNKYDFDSQLNSAYKSHGLDKLQHDAKLKSYSESYIDPKKMEAIRYSSYPRYYCKSNSNLRNGPGTGYGVILTMEKLDYVRVINKRTTYDIYGRPSVFWEVFHVGSAIRGYVHKSLLLPDR